ncbi:ABC transporter permease subunit, partial [Acinetobacter baumannii]|uniref:ABC transporter permease subunit n=2 Tax=Pseudomonadota TaxID=1224 RepID=UPI000F9ED26D
MESLAPLIAASINAGTPLLLAALGLLMNERSGVLNLGAEGMMLVAAVAGFMVGYQTQIPLLGFAAGAIAGMVMAALFAWLALVLVTNQVATGLALSIFGTGLSAFMGQRFVGMSLPAQAHGIPGLESI